MSSTRTAKAIANELDHNYFVRPTRRRIIRRVLIILFCVGTLVFWGSQSNQGNQVMYSPGPLTSVHAMWDGNNCSWCHQPKPEGGFFHAVTDNACIQCHDGAVHHPSQTTLVALDAQKLPMRSADCTSCHTEHRGHEQLVSRADSTCTQCHADLPAVTQGGTTQMQATVTAFAPGQHPPFGRSLTRNGQWSDPTPLRFNHQAHQVHVKPLAGQTENCTTCHEPTADRMGEMALMAPVSYERHCASCHSLELIQGAGIVLPHESLELVRPYISGALDDLSQRFRQELDAMPAADRAKELVTIQVVKARTPPFKETRKEVQIPPEQWVAKRVAGVTGELKKWYEDVGPSIPGFDGVRAAITADAPATMPAGGAAAGPPTDPWLDPRMVEFYATHIQPGIKSQNRCNLCHDLSDDPASVQRLSLASGPPMNGLDLRRSKPPLLTATAPASAPAEPATRPARALPPLATLATGYADAPRHWFVNSRFDHRAHRLMSCVDCHAQGKVSTATSDVLMPRMESCAQCHTPQSAQPASAGASCLTCHDYHDRHLERSTGPHFHTSDLLKAPPPATQPGSGGR